MGWRHDGMPSPGDVRRWQLDRLRDGVEHARTNSPFYASTLDGVDISSVDSPEAFSRLPMITPDDLRAGPERLLCVSQDEIARIVTLQSSGTTGQPKRIFNTQEDLEATIDFFDWGMRNLVEPGETALVLMPGERPGGVGRLLDEALSRFGARAVAHGIMENSADAVSHLLSVGASCIVGSAAHVNLIAREWQLRGLPKGMIRSILFCWDAVPDAVVRNAERIFGCRPFRHWGMIETGLGGAVECAPGSGMHLREADVYLEIVDPETGRLLPDGDVGEIVVSTPLRRGMPLIRYRTGDVGRILPGACSCGSPLRRLDASVCRESDGVRTEGGALALSALNERLYSIPGLGDFAVWLSGRTLRVRVSGDEVVGQRVRETLAAEPALGANAGAGLRLDIEMNENTVPAVPGLGKRRIFERESSA
jgi:phenylacetate-coenzyme A ligase PaaK-like adenylate-forming protein